jgi:hypothetical protein
MPKDENSAQERALRGCWHGMKSRCENPQNPQYKDYGARGIRVCSAWSSSYENFRDDMGYPPEGKVLDRIDNNKGYQPDNCRWATYLEQNNNRRRFKKNISGYAGVTQDKILGHWHASICINGKQINLYNGPSRDKAIMFRLAGEELKKSSQKA